MSDQSKARETNWILLFMLGAMFGGASLLFAVTQLKREGVYISCDIAEISPDIPVKAKEECRRRREQGAS